MLLYREARSCCQQGLIAEGIDLLRRALVLDPTQARFTHAARNGAEQRRAPRRGAGKASITRLRSALPTRMAAAPTRWLRWAGLRRRSGASTARSRVIPAPLPTGAIAALLSSISATPLRPPTALRARPRSLPTLRKRTTTTAMRSPSSIAMPMRLRATTGALALKPDYVDALNNRANALNQLGRLPEALAGVEAALARVPEHARCVGHAQCAAAEAPPFCGGDCEL